MDLAEELLNRYEISIIESVENKHKLGLMTDKCEALSKQLEELSRTITVLRDTLKCHNDFLDNGDLREDYEKFKDKWIEGGNV